MQDRYTADVGDFGKYGLLRALCGSKPRLGLGIVWYLVPDESGADDGKHVAYLRSSTENERMFRACDPSLFDALREIINTGERKVAVIPKSGIFPRDTVYFDRALTFAGMPSNSPVTRDRRLAHRGAWAEQALAATKRCEIVFADPDNGLEVKTQAHHRRGPKHVFYDELLPYLGREQSLVIYHHIGRNGNAQQQVERRFRELDARQGGGPDSFALLYHRGTCRVFFVIPALSHADTLKKRARHFADGPWGQHFEMIPGS